MDKKQILKIGFAIVAVAALIFELFAFGVLGGQRQPSIADNGGQPLPEERNLIEFQGTVRAT